MQAITGWGYRPKSVKPRIVHIRKASTSANSTVSTSALSVQSEPIPCTPFENNHHHHIRSSSAASVGSSSSFDPLRAHPVKHAPPRLHSRPMIRQDSPRFPESMTFPDHHEIESDELHPVHHVPELSLEEPYRGYSMSIFEDDSDMEAEDDDNDEQDSSFDDDCEVPSMVSDTESEDVQEIVSEFDYFHLPFAKPPALPRSRWSESTIHTLCQPTPAASNAGTPLAFAENKNVANLPNFSYKRNTVPRRPPMKHVDTVEDVIKRGGWKRRGIVFDEKEVSETQ